MSKNCCDGILGILNEDKLDKHEKGLQSLNCKPLFFGAPKEIRTPDPLVRRHVAKFNITYINHIDS